MPSHFAKMSSLVQNQKHHSTMQSMCDIHVCIIYAVMQKMTAFVRLLYKMQHFQIIAYLKRAHVSLLS